MKLISNKINCCRFGFGLAFSFLALMGPITAHANLKSQTCSRVFERPSSEQFSGSWTQLISFPKPGDHGEISQNDQIWVHDIVRRFSAFASSIGLKSHSRHLHFWNNFFSNVVPGYSREYNYRVSLSAEVYATRDETMAAHELSHLATADMMGLDFIPSNLVWVVSESFSDVLMMIFTGKSIIGQGGKTPNLRSFNPQNPLNEMDRNLTAKSIGQRSYRGDQNALQTDGHLASVLVSRFLYPFYEKSPATFLSQFQKTLAAFGAFYRPLLQSDFSYVANFKNGREYKSLPEPTQLQVTIVEAFLGNPDQMKSMVGKQDYLLKLLTAVQKVQALYPVAKDNLNHYSYMAAFELHLVAAITLKLAPESEVIKALASLEGNIELARELSTLLF